MTEFIFFLVGLMLGGCIGVLLMCLMQINRLNHYTEHKEVEQNEKTNR